MDENNDSDIGVVTINVQIPTHDRGLTIELSGHLQVSGQLSITGGGADFCLDTQTIEIQQLKGAEFVEIDEVTTNASGAYTANVPDEEGTYRARAVASTAGPGPDNCAATNSGEAVHDHKTRLLTLNLQRHLTAKGKLSVDGGGAAVCIEGSNGQDPAQEGRPVEERRVR